MTVQATETRGLKIALAGYSFLLVLQLVLYFMTHILVLLAIAFEILASLLIAALLFHAAVISRKPPDATHMFGYGRAQYVAAVVAAVVFISFMSVEVFRQAIPKFFQPPDVSRESIAIALIAIIISMLVLAIPIIDILRVKAKSASLKGQLISSLEDESAFAAGLIGTILMSKGLYIADPVSSIIVAMFIVLGGVYLIRDNAPYLLSRAPGPEFIARIIQAAKSVDGVLDVHDLKAEYIGHETIHTGFHIVVPRGILIEEADRIAHEVHERVSHSTGCQHCVIHVHPADSLTE